MPKFFHLYVFLYWMTFCSSFFTTRRWDKVLIIHLPCSLRQNLLLNALFLKALIGTMEILHWCQVFELIKQAIWAHHPRESYYCSWLNLTAAHQSSAIPIILSLQPFTQWHLKKTATGLWTIQARLYAKKKYSFLESSRFLQSNTNKLISHSNSKHLNMDSFKSHITYHPPRL